MGDLFIRLLPYGITALVVLATYGGTYYVAYHAGRDSILADQAERIDVEQRAIAAAQRAAADAVKQIKVQNTTVRQEVIREIQTNPVYRDCEHSPEQLQRINDAITAGARSGGAGVVPRADTTGRAELRRDD